LRVLSRRPSLPQKEKTDVSALGRKSLSLNAAEALKGGLTIGGDTTTEGREARIDYPEAREKGKERNRQSSTQA